MMVIAERILTVGGADPVRVPVRLFAPVQRSPQEWSCRGEIVWPDRKMDITAAGLDSAQALVLALQMIGSAVYSSSYHQAGNLLWERAGGGYGFPVAGSLRDLLQGEDAKFF